MIFYQELHHKLKNTNKIPKSLKLPIGLKFSMGELDVTPSREAIRYTEKTKTIIKKRLIELFKYLDKNINKNDSNVYYGDIISYSNLFLKSISCLGSY